MRSPSQPLGLLALTTLALSSTACGLTGATSRFKLELPIHASAPVGLTKVELEPRAAQLTNVGSYAWGKYDGADLENLEGSLRDTLEGATGQGAALGRVHVVVRSYLVATSNSQGGVLACVAWAYTNQDGRLLFHEQFYATGSAYMNKTLGGLKDEVHEAIVRRIAETAVHLAKAPAESIEPARPEHTYDTFAEAEGTVPKELTSTFFAWGLTAGYHWTVSGSTTYEAAKRTGVIDWETRLAAR